MGRPFTARFSATQCPLPRALDLPGGRASIETPLRFGAKTGDVLNISPVGCGQVVSVQAVLCQQLPVGLHGVPVGTCDHPHPLLGLIHDQVEVFPGSCQVRHQVLDLGIEAHEDEPPVAFDPGRLFQAQFAPVEPGSIGILAGHPDQLPVSVESPGVIETLEHFGVP